MKTRWNRRDLAIGLVLVATLLTLALLQYRWIAQVREADSDRLQLNLRSSVNRFTENFNGELDRLAQIVLGARNGAVETESVANRLELWREASRHPQIVTDVWLSDAPDLPPALQPLAATETTGGRGGRRAVEVDPNIPAFSVPRGRGGPGAPGGSPPSPGRLIVEMNMQYIRDTWLPELAAQNFGPDFYVEVLGAPGQVIYSTPGAGKHGPVEEGGKGGLFTLRTGGFGRGRGGPPPDSANNGGAPDFGGRGRFGAGPPGADDAPWRVHVSYRAGSLQETVDGFRRRNLAISFGILLLMGVSVGMMMWSSRRASALAEQQMEFVAGVTHELRTPLAVILSASQNLADGVTSGEQQTRRYGGVIRDQSRRLSGMVEQVLRFAGLSSQHGEIQRAPLDVTALVEGAIADCDPEFAAVGSRVVTEITPELPQILGDKDSLAHCLRNLLGNAAKHGEGSVVHVRAQAVPGDRVEISVEDRGPGIDAEDLAHIFEPFYRGKRAREEQVQGSGLGLSLVKKIVEAHDGTVEVDSRVGQGTTFRLLLSAVKTS